MLDSETGHGTVEPVGRGELRPESVRLRGWTPEALSSALARIGLQVSRRTISRCLHRGEIPGARTSGGHWRVDAGYVARTWPSLG